MLAGCLAFLVPGNLRADDLIRFSWAEIVRILTHGSWPPPLQRDPSNRVSGKLEAASFGEHLFFSARLSNSGGMLCASCHEPWRAYADGRDRGQGSVRLDRNTPSVVDVRFNRWFGWDGANDNLWAQSIRPILDPREMGSSAAEVAALIRGDRDLAELYRVAFGAAPPANDEQVLVDAGKALAAYQETLVSGRTPFDEFRDALARKDIDTASRYPRDAQRGLQIFIGKGSCAGCHSGPTFSDGLFHRTGVVSILENGQPDAGRQLAVRKLSVSRYNLLGPYNDDPARSTAAGTRAAATEQGTAGAFRTPGLRSVALTAPYMHDGSQPTLCDVVARHPAPGLTSDEMDDLVAFLRSLTSSATPRLEAKDSASCS